MKSKIIFIFILFTNLMSLKAQEIIIKGTFQGRNLYILNPAVNLNDEIFCVSAVYVNNILTEDELKSNSFEIDFANLKIQEGEKVTVRIIHKPDCKPDIINTNVLESSTNFTYSPPKLDKKSNKLNWTISGTLDDNPFIIEQYRWEKWITIGEVFPKDSVGENNFAYEPRFNTKQNIFRIKHIDKSGIERLSKECKYFVKDEELYLISTRITDWLYFSSETIYEIFDEKGNFILDGYGKEVNFTDIEKGKYWINYDNKTEVVTKK